MEERNIFIDNRKLEKEKEKKKHFPRIFTHFYLENLHQVATLTQLYYAYKMAVNVRLYMQYILNLQYFAG